jgi:hypothetical protein
VLQESCDDVEAALARLEDMVETQDLQGRQLDHRFQLAMYKEKKLAGLEALRCESNIYNFDCLIGDYEFSSSESSKLHHSFNACHH